MTARYLFWPCSMKLLIVLGHVKQTYMSYALFIIATALPLYSPDPPSLQQPLMKMDKGHGEVTRSPVCILHIINKICHLVLV